MKHCIVGELWGKLSHKKKICPGPWNNWLMKETRLKGDLQRPQDPESRTNCVTLLAVTPSASDGSLVTQIHQALFWGW